MLACKDGVPPRLTHTVFLQETVGQIDFVQRWLAVE